MLRYDSMLKNTMSFGIQNIFQVHMNKIAGQIVNAKKY